MQRTSAEVVAQRAARFVGEEHAREVGAEGEREGAHRERHWLQPGRAALDRQRARRVHAQRTGGHGAQRHAQQWRRDDAADPEQHGPRHCIR